MTSMSRPLSHSLAMTLAIALFACAAVFAASPTLAAEMPPADIAAMSQSGSVTPPVAVGTAFTYQGRLLISGAPANGPYDLQFRVMDAAAGGGQLGSTVVVDNAAVSDGRFTVQLNVGLNVFGGGARWLEISVRPGAGGAYTLLSPRQELKPAPYALAMPNVYTTETTGFVGVGRSFQISSAEYFGVHAPVGSDQYGGMYVNSESAGGWPFYGFATAGTFRAWTYFDGNTSMWKLYNGGDRLIVPAGGGLEITSTSTTDGIRINDTPDDGVQIGTGSVAPNYGVYIPSPGVATICLLVYTADASNNYALYTSDNIEAGTVTLTAQKVIVRVGDGGSVSRGDVVMASGFDDPIDGGSDRLAVVQRAAGGVGGVIGVVASRLEWQTAPGKEDDGVQVLTPVDGPAQAGDYVAMVTQGVADVHVQRGASISKGTRLTAGDADGAVRPLRVESLNGMPVSEGAPVVGVALADANGRDTVPVFVNIH